MSSWFWTLVTWWDCLQSWGPLFLIAALIILKGWPFWLSILWQYIKCFSLKTQQIQWLLTQQHGSIEHSYEHIRENRWRYKNGSNHYPTAGYFNSCPAMYHILIDYCLQLIFLEIGDIVRTYSTTVMSNNNIVSKLCITWYSCALIKFSEIQVWWNGVYFSNSKNCFSSYFMSSCNSTSLTLMKGRVESSAQSLLKECNHLQKCTYKVKVLYQMAAILARCLPLGVFGIHTRCQ